MQNNDDSKSKENSTRGVRYLVVLNKDGQRISSMGKTPLICRKRSDITSTTEGSSGKNPEQNNNLSEENKKPADQSVPKNPLELIEALQKRGVKVQAFGKDALEKRQRDNLEKE